LRRKRDFHLPDRRNQTGCSDIAVFCEQVNRVTLILRNQGRRYNLAVVHLSDCCQCVAFLDDAAVERQDSNARVVVYSRQYIGNLEGYTSSFDNPTGFRKGL
jgi:hypothetical protein